MTQSDDLDETGQKLADWCYQSVCRMDAIARKDAGILITAALRAEREAGRREGFDYAMNPGAQRRFFERIAKTGTTE